MRPNEVPIHVNMNAVYASELTVPDAIEKQIRDQFELHWLKPLLIELAASGVKVGDVETLAFKIIAVYVESALTAVMIGHPHLFVHRVEPVAGKEIRSWKLLEAIGSRDGMLWMVPIH